MLQLLYQGQLIQDMNNDGQKHVVVIGGGLSGLTAANEIVKKKPNTKLTVLQALDYLGGRAKTIVINDCPFDQGGGFIGRTQHHVIQLAHQSKNELLPVNSKGKKVIEFKDQIGTYTSNIPNKVSIFALIQLQWSIWKINRMAKKVPTLNPKDCQMGYQWDSITLKSWLDQNLSFTKLKVMVQAAIRVILGVQLGEVSLLYFLYYVNQSKDFDNLINIQNGLQETKPKLGAQHMCTYLGEQIMSRGGSIKLKFYVSEVIQHENKCLIKGEDGSTMEADYIIMAMPPCSVNRIRFTPQLSTQRRFINQRSIRGNLLKVILLYKQPYWLNKNFSGECLSDCYDSPVMNVFDDSKINNKGQLQPALIVFVGGGVYRYWKDRVDFKEAIVKKLAEYYKEPAMLHPTHIHYHAWDQVRSIGGAPVFPFAPGALSQIDDLRKPQGRIHWAGTEMATVSTGFMDGAIESGKRVASQIVNRLENIELRLGSVTTSRFLELPYSRYVYGNGKMFEWW